MPGARWKLFILDNFIWIIDILVYLAFAVYRPVMFSVSLIRWIIYASVPLAFLVFAESIILITGNIDLSISGICSLSAMATAALFIRHGHWGIFSFIPPILIGICCGVINGFLTVNLRINSFLSTLATSMIFTGGTLLISSYALYGCFPDYYLLLGGDEEVALIFLITTLLILWFILTRTQLGSNLCSVGGNLLSSKMMGISTERTIFYAFIMSGFLCGLAGIVYTGYLKSVPPSLASNVNLLPAIAAAVMGGVSLFGGRGSIVNAYGGTLLSTIITAGLVSLNVNVFVRQMVFGVVIAIAVFINNVRERIRDKILAPKI